MGRINNQLLFTSCLILTYLGVGTWFFSWQEGWRHFDAFYFSAVTLTTVGYGDFLPTTDLSKLMAIFFAFSGISIIFYSLSLFARKYFEHQEEKFDKIRHLPLNLIRNNKTSHGHAFLSILQGQKPRPRVNIKKMTASQILDLVDDKE